MTQQGVSTTATTIDPAQPRPATIAVVGLGAIGSVVAGSLVAAGRHDVVVCVRTPVDRLVVERPDDTIDVAVRAVTDPAAVSAVDWVLLATKVHQTASAAGWLARLCGPATKSPCCRMASAMAAGWRL